MGRREAVTGLAWEGLRALKLARTANSILGVVYPPAHRENRLAADAAAERRKHADQLRVLGHLTIEAHMGQLPVDPKLLDPIWEAIKTRQDGLHFADVTDPHNAKSLEAITPLHEALAQLSERER